MLGLELRARRTQIPLTLAYALTIHRAQGMQLDRVELGTDGVFEAGQVYVGLSRVTSLSGLYLTEFDPRKVRAHPAALRFYAHVG
jgi:ATP-dependent DNA helicase PIF1